MAVTAAGQQDRWDDLRAKMQADDKQGPASGPTVEIRSHNLKPGRRDEFHALFVRDSLPLLRQRNIDVVAYGPSLHDRDSYFLIRAFSSLRERDQSEDAFYKSAEWINGPRAVPTRAARPERAARLGGRGAPSAARHPRPPGERHGTARPRRPRTGPIDHRKRNR